MTMGDIMSLFKRILVYVAAVAVLWIVCGIGEEFLVANAADDATINQM